MFTISYVYAELRDCSVFLLEELSKTNDNIISTCARRLLLVNRLESYMENLW